MSSLVPLDTQLARSISDQVLAVMDRKDHWAYPSLTRPGLSRAQLLEHFRHENAVFVRDFPILLARALGLTPPIEEVRRALAENIYEEQTGELSRTAAHPELFLRMMEGLGLSRAQFAVAGEEAWLLPEARAYRDFLREGSATGPWQAAVALMTLWVEGSVNERAELAGTFVRRRGEAAIAAHPLVVHYGCPTSAMTLARAHGDIEGSHRGDAWRIVIGHTLDAATAEIVVDRCSQACALWHSYRDAVADRMGLRRERAA
ncbi:MAG: iron-containing redox enzyme family protein [Polyangiales bacterium]